MQLTTENYKNGFLIDSEWMASITENEGTDFFQAYVVNHVTGDVVYFELFETLPAAIQRLSQIPRSWVYESASGCGGCGKNESNGGACSGGKGCASGGSCKKGKS